MSGVPPSRGSGGQPDERLRRRVTLAYLEADAAYFQARLEIIGDPTTANQQAQRMAFKELHKFVGEKIVRVKREMVKDK